MTGLWVIGGRVLKQEQKSWDSVENKSRAKLIADWGWGPDSPAVDHYGPGFWGVEELDLADEAQKAGGVAGNTMVRPAGEVEET